MLQSLSLVLLYTLGLLLLLLLLIKPTESFAPIFSSSCKSHSCLSSSSVSSSCVTTAAALSTLSAVAADNNSNDSNNSNNNSNDDDVAFAAAALQVADAAGKLRGQTIVVKYGGNAMTSPELKTGFCQDVAALQKIGVRVVVVHGGGPQISNMLEKVGVETRFEGGFRVSSTEVVEVAEMVLCGSVNKEISSAICSAGGRAIGISGRDDSLLQCIKQHDDKFDLGFVGQVQNVNTNLLQQLLDAGICPVVSPIGTGINEEKNIAYNVNADVAAGRIAGELKAARVLFLTDIAGVLDKQMELLPTLSVEDIQKLIDDETITGGMIPKVSYATSAVQLGVGGAFITDGRIPHALIKQVLGGDQITGGGTFVTLN